MKTFIYILLCLPFIGFAQLPPNQPEQDCINAIRVCRGSYNQPNSYQGQGAVPNEIPLASCLRSNERASTWYIFTAETTGQMSFSITPNDLGDDYDWAVYNISNNGCGGIPTGASPEVSCNYSGAAGVTGANNQGGTQNEPTITVTAGQTFALNVSNFSQTSNGYFLQFNVVGGGASIFDNVPPSLASVTAPTIGGTTVIIQLSEFVPCGAVRASDFVLLDPDGLAIPVAGISSAACTAGGRVDNTFTLNLGGALSKCGQYTLQLTGTIVDACGNSSAITSRTFSPSNLPAITVNILSQSTSCDSVLGANGTAQLVINPPQANVDIEWSHLSQTGYTAIQLPAGPHSVTTYLFNRTCPVTTNFRIVHQPAPLGIQVQAFANTACDTIVRPNGQAILIPNDSNLGSYTWSWSSNYQPDQESVGNLPPNDYFVEIQHRILDCIDTIEFTIADSSKPINIEIVKTDAFCGRPNGEAHLNVIYAGVTPYTILWSNGRNRDLNYNTGLDTGAYLLYIEDQVGCYDSIPFTIVDTSRYTINPDTFPDTCFLGKGRIELNPQSQWVQQYHHYWSPNPDTTDAIDSLNTGTYTVITVNQWGCLSYDTIYVPPLSDTPQAQFSFRDSILILNPTVDFEDSSKNQIRWFWAFGDGFFSTDSTPTHTYANAGSYNVIQTVTDRHGCKDTMEHLLVIHYYPMLYLPNAFTPNGDPWNNEFKVVASDIDPSDFIFRVYDRWNNLVFYTTDPTVAWNGRLHNTGEFAQIDVYNYEVYYKGLNGRYDKHIGSVSLIK